MKKVIQSALLVSALFITSAALGQGRLVGVNSTGMFEISMTDASRVQISTLAAGAGTVSGLAHDWNNNITYMANSSNQNIMTVNVNTGVFNTFGTYGLGSTPVMHGLEYNMDTDQLYGHSGGSTHGYHLYNINTGSGAASFIGTSSQTSFHNLGYDSINNIMYMTNSNTDSLYTIDLATNVSTLVGSLGGPTNPNGVAFNHHTGVMYMIDNSTDNLYTINLQTGQATVVGSLGAGVNFLSLAYVPIPGPGGLALFALAGLIGGRKRRHG